jgi:hypothetical protein
MKRFSTVNAGERKMSKRARCENEDCTKCEGIVARSYRELRNAGYSDREAFFSTVRVLELRHPGHEKYYYFGRVAQWRGADSGSVPSG